MGMPSPQHLDKAEEESIIYSAAPIKNVPAG